MTTKEPISPKKRFFKPANIIKITLAFILIFFVLSKTDMEALFALRTKVLFIWVILAFGLFFLMTMLKAFQYHIFLKQDIGYLQILNIVVVQNVISNFIATGAGIASYFALSLVDQKVKLSRSGVAFILTKIGDVIAIWVFLLISSVLVWKNIIPLQGLVIGLLIFIGITILVVILSIMLRQIFLFRLRKVLKILKIADFKLVRLILSFFDEVVEQDDIYNLYLLIWATFYSLIYLLITMVWFYANIRSFDLKISIVAVVFVNIFIQLLSNIPVQAFGGLGINESTSLFLYHFFYPDQQKIASALIGIRVLFYLMNLATLIYLPIHNRFKRKHMNDTI